MYIGVFAAFVGLGFYIWRGYKCRKVFFQNILDFSQHLLVEISFSKSTVRSIIDRYGQSYGAHFREVLNGYQALLDEKADITRERIETLVWKKIKKSERQCITDFFYELGRHGASEERQKIENRKITFDTFFNDADKALRRDASIYLKLFILLGVGVVIILI